MTMSCVIRLMIFMSQTRHTMEVGGLKRSLQAAEELKQDLDTRITELEEYKGSSERTLSEALYDNHRMQLTLSRSLDSITVLLTGSMDGGGLAPSQAASSTSGVSTEVFTLMSGSGNASVTLYVRCPSIHAPFLVVLWLQ